MEAKQTRNIPLPIQRTVRQRCGFGCVVCGFPLYEYHHINEWSNLHEHTAEDITLLCPTHHHEVTVGLLPHDKIQFANAYPYNVQKGCCSPYDLHFEGLSCDVEIGGNRFTTSTGDGDFTESIPISVDGIPIIGFVLQDNRLLLNVNLFDQYNQLVLRINNNQLSYSVNPWDIQLVGRQLTIREKERQLLINMTFSPPNKVIIDRGRLLLNGVEILIENEHILVTNNNILISGCQAHNCHGGLIIGNTSKPIGGFMRINRVNRYLGDNKDSIRWAKNINW